ncbi:BON domain-containing protein [Paraburkholderia caribensis]|uniref:BON domain-containing protein n=1 Tax=Paraburkholderia caribensis TaxID=75105 RepID=UPI0007227CBC|nr:BON domain-containing protein [Paraburkholderia caribensis]ALP65418.1 hypothetical protein AN416_22850 [Paraburkholderia caribensis]AUT55661.1 hypothetical protein C2L66_28700 [Paraburkholderia caribensis]
MARWIVWIMLVIASGACNVPRAQEASSAAPAGERRNWYNDPFFALSHAIADCPVPLGPMMTHAQMEDDAHYRVERGTTCWLAHQCTKPNSYLYDADIASAIRARFTSPHPFDGTSVWITVQRRFVYAEGCAPASFDRRALQQQLEAIPDVEQVFMRIAASPHGRMPYKTLAEPDTQPVTEPATEPVAEPATEQKPKTR